MQAPSIWGVPVVYAGLRAKYRFASITVISCHRMSQREKMSVDVGAAYVDADPVFGPRVAHVSVPFPAPPGASSACIPCRNRISGCGTAS